MIAACISDTHLHGPGGLPDWCTEQLERADLILHAGDIVTREALSTIERLAPVVAVCGNMDELGLKQRLPKQRVAEIGDIRIGVVHDAGPERGRAARLLAAFSECDAVVYGHTHVPELRRVEERWILNPGSPTSRRAGPPYTMLVIEIDERTIKPQLISA